MNFSDSESYLAEKKFIEIFLKINRYHKER